MRTKTRLVHNKNCIVVCVSLLCMLVQFFSMAVLNDGTGVGICIPMYRSQYETHLAIQLDRLSLAGYTQNMSIKTQRWLINRINQFVIII